MLQNQGCEGRGNGTINPAQAREDQRPSQGCKSHRVNTPNELLTRQVTRKNSWKTRIRRGLGPNRCGWWDWCCEGARTHCHWLGTALLVRQNGMSVRSPAGESKACAALAMWVHSLIGVVRGGDLWLSRLQGGGKNAEVGELVVGWLYESECVRRVGNLQVGPRCRVNRLREGCK